MNISRNRVLVLMLAALFAIGVVGCGDDDESATTSEDAAMKQDEAMKQAEEMKQEEAMKKEEAMKRDSSIKISVGDVDPYGGILQNAKGLTIYLFTKEKSKKSECYGECAEAWPPVTTKSQATAGRGIDEDKLGTTKRRDGTRQVTYNGHPLYYYRGETQRDQVLCQAVDEFGGIWYVVDKDGDAITTTS